MKNSRVEITHAVKILFPKSHITKEDLIHYYERAFPKMLPLIKDRPITMERFPNGIGKKGFLQKNISDFFPKWVKRASVQRKNERPIEMVVGNNLDTLLYITNLACITPHIWTSKIRKPNYPDRLIFDLDPSGKKVDTVIQAARDLRDLLEDELSLPTFLMTTGSKGLHVVIPIKPSLPYEEVRDFARSIAELLSLRFPKKYTSSPRKEKRKGKVYIDYLRNGYGQMAVAPYAVRPLEKGPIATPIHWRELTSKFHPQQFNLKNIQRRLGRDCPWKNMDKKAISIKKKIDLVLEISTLSKTEG